MARLALRARVLLVPGALFAGSLRIEGCGTAADVPATADTQEASEFDGPSNRSASEGKPAEQVSAIDAALAGLSGAQHTISAEMLASLRDSTDPAEQRAWRLLAARGDLPGIAPASLAASGTASAEGGDAEPDPETPVAPGTLVVSDAAAVEDEEPTPPSGETGGAPATADGDTSAGPPVKIVEDTQKGSPVEVDGDEETAAAAAAEEPTVKPKKPTTPSKPKPVADLTMVTRITLHERGNDVELEVVAAGPLAVGTVRGEASLRVVVEDAGALPAAMQARPVASDVRVTDVRRGDETVQIAVELPEGWRVASKRTTSSGARIRFAAR